MKKNAGFTIRLEKIAALVSMLFLFVSCMDTGGDVKKGRTVASFGVKKQTTETPTPTPTPEIKRPGAPGTDEQVFIKPDFCSCLNKKSDILNDCDAFCSTKNTSVATLYMNFTVGADIALNSELQNLNGWCTKEIDDGNTAPGCDLVFSDGSSENKIAVVPSNTSNSIAIDISSQTQKNVTYLVFLREKTSGAVSKKVQLRRIDPPSTSPELGLLKISPITLFSCIFRTGSSGTFNTFNYAFKRHFLFVDQNAPPALPSGTVFTLCHDSQAFGANDNVLYPRLEQTPNNFRMWNQTDSRFMDQINETGASTPNQKADVNDIVNKKLKDAGSTLSGEFFQKLDWSSYPGTTNAPRLGYYLTPFVDTVTNRATCPSQSDYNSNNTLYNILRDLVGVDTEGIWLAQKEAECYTDSSNVQQPVPDDIIIIREHLLKKIWFYNNNGQPTEPTESIFNSGTSIHFYWPADELFPFTRKSTQKLYTIRFPSEIGSSTSSLCGTSNATNSSSNSSGGGPSQSQFSTYMSSDKRFGCVPAILD